MHSRVKYIIWYILFSILFFVLVACKEHEEVKNGILFSAIDRGNEQIFVVDEETGDTRLLIQGTEDKQHVGDPIWSPKRNAVLYRVWDENQEETSLWVARMDEDRVDPIHIASSILDEDNWPGKWSFDGQYVAHRERSDSHDPSTSSLLITDLTTLQTSEIVTGAWGFTWSPAENLVAVCRWAGNASGLYIFEPNGSQHYVLPISETQQLLCNPSMTWRPHSWEITFLCPSGICSVDPRSGEMENLILESSDYPNRHVSMYAWSPDGYKLLFVADYNIPNSNEMVERSLFVLNTVTGKEQELAAHDLVGISPVWSLDANRVAFVAPGEHDSGAQVFVVETQTGLITQLTHDNTLKFSLAW